MMTAEPIVFQDPAVSDSMIDIIEDEEGMEVANEEEKGEPATKRKMVTRTPNTTKIITTNNEPNEELRDEKGGKEVNLTTSPTGLGPTDTSNKMDTHNSVFYTPMKPTDTEEPNKGLTDPKADVSPTAMVGEGLFVRPTYILTPGARGHMHTYALTTSEAGVRTRPE